MSFIEIVQEITKESAYNLQIEREQRIQLRNQIEFNIKDHKFKELVNKYYQKIINSILNAAKRGISKVYINFDKEDFKANFPGLGNPRQFQRLWLEELSKPDSEYIPVDEKGNKKSFQGISFDIWNNRCFTTVFRWD